MIEFLTLKNKAFGLDFCDLSVKVAAINKKGNFFKLSSWGEAALDLEIIEEGEVKDDDGLSEAIKKALSDVKGEKIKNKKAIISLPETKAFFEIIKMPKMEEKELASAISFEAENYIPLPIKDAYLDFQIVPQANGHLLDSQYILLGAISKSLVDPYVLAVKKAGIIPYALEIESQAISRALVKNNVSPYPLLLIDFGKSRTNLVIFSGYSLQFTSSLPIFSDMMSMAVAKSLRMNFNEAEELLMNYGLSFFFEEEKDRLLQKKIFNAVNPVLNDLIDQIKKYLVYYETHTDDAGCKNRRVSKILLSGYGGNIKHLGEFISSSIKIPVEFGNPWVNILSDPLKPNMPLKESLRYTTALGLALRGAKENND